MVGQKEEVCFESLVATLPESQEPGVCAGLSDLMRSEGLSGASLNANLCAVCTSEYLEVFLTCILSEIGVIVMCSNIIVVVKIIAQLFGSRSRHFVDE